MKKIAFFTLLLIGFSACERLFIKPDGENSRLANFDLLWQTLDEKYTYFTYKNIDWQALRNKYRPLAAAAKDEEALFQVMGDLLYELKDGHVNLYSYFDISRNWEWYLPYPPNFDFNVLERNYLGDDYQIAGAFRTKIIRNTGYIYYGSFQSPVTSLTIRELLQKYKQANVKGIIIDIRDNGGGSLGTADLIIQHFLSQKTLIGYTRYKNGPAHDDFTEYFPTELEPTSETFTGKVVLLTNRSVFSAANYFAAALSQLPNVTIIGDQTGGGGGAPITAELQIGWRVRYSGTQLFNADKEHLEPGVVPDIKLDISQADQINGKDTILERALDLLNQ